MKHFKTSIILAAALSILSLGSTISAKTYSDFKGTDYATGKETSLSTIIKGKVAVVDFWASWCGPCRNEITKYLIPLYDNYKDNKRVVIVGVDLSDKAADHDAAVKKLGIEYPQILDTKDLAGKLYGIRAIPYILVIDEKGEIIAQDVRGDEIEKAVKKALESKPSKQN